MKRISGGSARIGSHDTPFGTALTRKLTTMKLFSQFEAVLSATPFARNEDGKISAGIAHGLDEVVRDNRARPLFACRRACLHRAPAGAEADHVEQEEGDCGPALRQVRAPGIVVESNEHGNDGM